MYQIKQIPEDFIVKEELDLPIEPSIYSYFLLKKRNLTTYKAIIIISQKLHIHSRSIGYAGLKDKHAVTFQYISIKGNHPYFNINQEDLTLEYVNMGKDPINLGSLNSNHFEITLRDIDKKEELKIINKKSDLTNSFPNYFDKQRFSKNNAEIGKLLIKKEFKKAAELLIENNHPELILAIEKNKTDYVGAIRRIPKKILMLYLHSYQSLLFNNSLNQYIKINTEHKTKDFDFGELSFTKQYEDINFDLPGFDSKQQDLPEDISPRDFIMRQLPNLSLELQKRKAFVKPINIKFSEFQNDELNKGKKKITITFTLLKGSYATMFTKSLFV